VTCDQRRFAGAIDGDEMLQEQRVFHNTQFIARILGEDGDVSHNVSISLANASLFHIDLKVQFVSTTSELAFYVATRLLRAPRTP
jgi:hypothetical protein